jgi:hypothetical protein
LKSEDKFSFMSRFAIKFIEVAGAGLASALCAYFLGQIERGAAPATAFVQISPATIENAAGEGRVAAIGRSDGETQPEHTATAAPTASSVPKPAKSASVPAARRTQTSEQGPSAEPKRRSGEPLAIQPPAVASNPAPTTAAQNTQAAPGRDEPGTWNSDEQRPLLARLKQIPAWFLPENDRVFGDLPRPPMPVGESLRSAL